MSDTITLFRSVSDAETYPEGHVLFREGEPGHTMYAVQEGEVDLSVRGSVVETVGPGGIFGEMSLLFPDHRRSATAVVRVACRLVPIGERQFSFLVQQTPRFALQIMRVIAGRLVRMDERS